MSATAAHSFPPPSPQPIEVNPELLGPSLQDGFYIIHENGFYHVPGCKYLGSVPKLAELINKQSAVRIPRAFTIDGLTTGPSDVVLKDGMMFAGLRLTSIRIKTHFRTVDNGTVLVPTFMSDGGDTLLMDLEWRPPADMEVILGVRAFVDRGAYKYNGDDTAPIFFARKIPSSPGFFRLPLPNVFNDGRVCTGIRTSFTKPDVQSYCAAVLERFRENPWNSDLLDGRGSLAQSMFRFSMADNSQLPPADGSGSDWTTSCQRVSHAQSDLFVPVA